MRYLKIGFSLILSLCFFLGGCGIAKSEYAKPEDIKMTPARWSAEKSFLGMEYSEDEGGVLLTNTSSFCTAVKVTAKYYDDDKNYLDEDWKSVTLGANDSWFLFFDKDDDIAEIEYFVTTDEPLWDVVSLSEIEIEYKGEKVIVENNSEKDLDYCSIQCVYYKNKKIVDVVTITINDGHVPANEKVAADSLTTSADFDDLETNFLFLQ